MFFYSAYDDLLIDHWIPPTIIVGIIFTLLVGFIGSIDDNNSKVKKSIENTITANYDNVVNYHNNIEQSFVSDGSKYTFDYDDETKTLTVFTDTNANVDAIFIDGVKQKGEK